MSELRVLFVCIHNSGRSQMAEAWMNRLGAGQVCAESAGIEPGRLNPVVVEVMGEIGVDISRNQTKSVFDLCRPGRLYDFVITVCDEASAEKCPVFPGVAKRIHWGFPDPAAFAGDPVERLEKTRAVRDQIRSRVEAFLKERAATPTR